MMRVEVNVEELRIIRDLGEKGWFIRIRGACEGEPWKVSALNHPHALKIESETSVLNALERLELVIELKERQENKK